MTAAQIGQAAEPSPFAALREVALLPSGDDVKRDLEMTCLTCGAHLCDAEPYDILEILALSCTIWPPSRSAPGTPQMEP